MAIQTIVVLSISDSSGQARLEIDIDDTTDPDNPAVIRGRVVNQLDKLVSFLFRRVNQAPWFSAEIAAGQTVSQNTGGPIRFLSDLPHMSLRT